MAPRKTLKENSNRIFCWGKTTAPPEWKGQIAGYFLGPIPFVWLAAGLSANSRKASPATRSFRAEPLAIPRHDAWRPGFWRAQSRTMHLAGFRQED
jgi:hypothetical protein